MSTATRGTNGKKRGEIRPRVAVIGSGLAGLATAYLLRQEGCEVYLIEKSDKLGFHSASVDIPLSGEGSRQDGAKSDQGVKDDVRAVVEDRKGTNRWITDVPMRSFQGGTWDYRSSPHISTFPSLTCSPRPRPRPESAQGKPGRTSSILAHQAVRFLPLPSTSSHSPFALLGAITYLVSTAFCFLTLIVLSFLSWHRLLPSLLGHTSTLGSLHASLTLAPFFQRFIDDVLVPVFSSVGTMTSLDVLHTPLPALLDYIHAGMGTAHYTLGSGFSAGTIAEMLVKPLRQQGEGYVRLHTTITGMNWDSNVNGGVVEITFEGGETVEVDKIVIATQASAARVLLSKLGPSLEVKEKKRVGGILDALREVDYRETIVITHRDRSVLPPAKDTRTINFSLPLLSPSHQSSPFTSAQIPLLSFTPSSPSTSASSGPQTPISDQPLDTVVPYFEPTREKIYTMGTHVIVPPLNCPGEQPVYQTTNPVVPIDPSTVLGIATLERALPLRDPTTFGRLHPSTDIGVVFLAGSYSYPGIPLLKDASAAQKGQQRGYWANARWDISVEWTGRWAGGA